MAGEWQEQRPMRTLNRQRPLSLSPSVVSPLPAHPASSICPAGEYTLHKQNEPPGHGTGDLVLRRGGTGETWVSRTLPFRLKRRPRWEPDGVSLEAPAWPVTTCSGLVSRRLASEAGGWAPGWWETKLKGGCRRE